jgi:hypothetical protein
MGEVYICKYNVKFVIVFTNMSHLKQSLFNISQTYHEKQVIFKMGGLLEQLFFFGDQDITSL